MSTEYNDLAQDKQFCEMMTEAIQMGEVLAATSVVVSGNGAVGGLLASMAPAIGAIRIVARIVGGCKEKKDVCNDHLWFALFLCGHTMDMRPDGVGVSFDPSTVSDALASFEKQFGRKPDAKLWAPMVKAARESDTQGKELLGQFMAKR